MKKRDPLGLATRDHPLKSMDKDKDSSSLPFPPSVLLTKPLGAESELPAHPKEEGQSLPSLTEFIDSYVKPHMSHQSSYSPRMSARVPSTPLSSSDPTSPPSMRSYGREEEAYHIPHHPHSHHSQPPHPAHAKQYAYPPQYMHQYQHIREQQMMGQQLFEQREMQYHQQIYDGQVRDHMRDQQYELQEQLREQQQRLGHPYNYEQYFDEHIQRRSSLPESPFSKVKREPHGSEYQQYPGDHKLSVREQLKHNLLQREPSVDSHGRTVNGKGSSHSPLTSPKHGGSGFTQHMFAVPTSPLTSSPPTYTPTTPKQSSIPTHFESTKFTNYTSQEFQQGNKSHPPSSPPTQHSPSILSANGGKWTQWPNEKDVYKQAKLLSESLQSNVKSYLDATNDSPTAPSSPSLSIQRAAPSIPPLPSPSSTSVTRISPRSSPSTPAPPPTPTISSNKRKASADANAAPAKVATLTPAQLELQKEAQLFSSKDIKAGMLRFNTLSNSSMLDIYNKFQRVDEFAQYSTTTHQPTPTTTN